VAYEWYCHDDASAPAEMRYGQTGPAARGDLIAYFERLEAALDDAGFFKAREMRPTVVRNLRAMFARAGLTDQEVRTLQGVLSALIRRKP